MVLNRRGITRIQAAVIAAVIIAASIAGGAYYYYSTLPRKQEILIGTVLSLTGAYADPSAHMLRAIKFYEEEINAQGGIYVADLGRKLPVRIILYDDTSDAETCTRMFEKLITVDMVDFTLGTYASVCWYAGSTVCEKYKMPSVCGSGLSSEIYERGYKYIFLVTAESKTKMASAFDLLMTLPADTRPKTIVLYEDDTPAARVHAEYGAAYAKKLGFQLLAFEFFPKETADFLPLLLKYKALNPDALMGGGYIKSNLMEVRILREIGWRPKFIWMASGPQVPEFVEGLKEDAEYITTTGPMAEGYPESYAPGLAKVLKGLRDKGLPTSVQYNAMGYSSCQVLQAAIEKAGTLDREKVREVLTKIEMSACQGPVKFDERGVNIKAVWNTLQIQKGKLVPVWPPAIRDAMGVKFWYPNPPKWGS